MTKGLGTPFSVVGTSVNIDQARPASRSTWFNGLVWPWAGLGLRCTWMG